MSEINLMLLLAGIAGLLMPYLVEQIKKLLKIESGKAKMFAAIAVSAIAGVIVAVATGQVDLTATKSYDDAAPAYAIILSIGQLFYHAYLKRK